MKRCQSILSLLVSCLYLATSLQAKDADVIIYGATPGGIAAALAAAKQDHTVHLIEAGTDIGGLVTSGLSHTDIHSFESITGTFLHFSQMVQQHYEETYGKNSPQVEACFRGIFGEPKVNLLVFQKMLEVRKSITVHKAMPLQDVKVENRSIQHAVFAQASGESVTFTGRVFIDATYEGDLMAKAGAAWRAGREGRAEFNESLAPQEPDDQLQAYNFRFIMTQDPANRVLPQAPQDYKREDFLGVLPHLQSGRIEKIFGYPSRCIFKAQTPALPNGKYDINDVSREVIRLSLPGKNSDWPNGNRETRRQIFEEHLRDQVGLLFFLQNDPDVPEKFQQEARQWGLAKDEFTDTNHSPRELYIREARRLQGVHIYSQQDSEKIRGDVRAKFFPDSIAMADYGNNCHGTAREGTRWDGKHTGEFYHPVPPYQIPFGVILPKEFDNLLVPVAVSSTHVGFCALRLEPIWTSLGQAAGHAAALALEMNIPVPNVPVASLQSRLHADGSATIYVSDVLPGHPDFSIVQWWGSHGGLHGLTADYPDLKPRGAIIHGQYSKAAPHHEFLPEKELDQSLRQKWLAFAERLAIPKEQREQATKAPTRGSFIRAIAPLELTK